MLAPLGRLAVQGGPARQAVPDMKRVYTDGACLGNPGPGGWAWAVAEPDGAFASGPDPATTNQRMEIKAALEAVLHNDGPMTVMTDSTYVCNCFRDRWWERWVASGWKTSAKKPVANRDLWEPLIDAVQATPSRVRFEWVKGHSNDPMNDLVDRLAVDAARTQEGRSGRGVPDDLGPADAVGPRGTGASSGPQPPGGRRMLVAGLRPPGLGGYDANPVADGVRSRLETVIRAKQELHPDLVVLTGLGLGAEQLGAEAAGVGGVPYVAVLPYPDQERVWPRESQDRYRSLLAGAAEQIVLQKAAPESRQKAGAALARRDAWLARHSDEALVVWDHDDAFVGRLFRSLKDHVGEEEVWVIEP
jgi:ribonuclease HI